MPQKFTMTSPTLISAALLLTCGMALAQFTPVAMANGTSALIMSEGLQKQRANQGLANAQLNRQQAARLQQQQHNKLPASSAATAKASGVVAGKPPLGMVSPLWPPRP